MGNSRLDPIFFSVYPSHCTGSMTDLARHAQWMALSLFLFGMLGILLFFYLAFLLTTAPLIPSATTDLQTASEDFFTYLIQITLPLVVLIVVGGISVLMAVRGIELYGSRRSD